MTCYQKSNDTTIRVKNIQKEIIESFKYLYGHLAPIMKEFFTKRFLIGTLVHI